MKRITTGQCPLSLQASRAVKIHQKQKEESKCSSPTPPQEGVKKWRFVRCNDQPKRKPKTFITEPKVLDPINTVKESDAGMTESTSEESFAGFSSSSEMGGSRLLTTSDPSALPPRLLSLTVSEGPASCSREDINAKLNTISLGDDNSLLSSVTESLLPDIGVIRSEVSAKLQSLQPQRPPPWHSRKPRKSRRTKLNTGRVKTTTTGSNPPKVSISLPAIIQAKVVAPLQFLSAFESQDVDLATINKDSLPDDFMKHHLQKLYLRNHPLRHVRVADVIPSDLIYSYKEVDGAVMQVQHNAHDYQSVHMGDFGNNCSPLRQSRLRYSLNRKSMIDDSHLSRLSTPASCDDQHHSLSSKRLELDELQVNCFGGVGKLSDDNNLRAKELIADQNHAVEVLKRRGLMTVFSNKDQQHRQQHLQQQQQD